MRGVPVLLFTDKILIIEKKQFYCSSNSPGWWRPSCTNWAARSTLVQSAGAPAAEGPSAAAPEAGAAHYLWAWSWPPAVELGPLACRSWAVRRWPVAVEGPTPDHRRRGCRRRGHSAARRRVRSVPENGWAVGRRKGRACMLPDCRNCWQLAWIESPDPLDPEMGWVGKIWLISFVLLRLRSRPDGQGWRKIDWIQGNTITVSHCNSCRHSSLTSNLSESILPG